MVLELLVEAVRAEQEEVVWAQNDGGDLDIWESLTIIGANGNADGNPSTTIIQARTTPGTFNDRVFHVLAAPEAEVTIQALTVRHGYIAWFDAGGAIATNDIGALTLSNLIIEQNGSRYGDGGALLLGARTVTIEKSIIRDNRSVYREGGAITIGGSAVTIRDSVISGNRAPDGNGGAIHLAGTVKGRKDAARGHSFALMRLRPLSTDSWRLLFCALRGR